MRYGIPYMGSKNRIAKWIVDSLPASDTLVDLFAGGCAEVARTKRMCSASRRGNKETTERLFVQERLIDAAVSVVGDDD